MTKTQTYSVLSIDAWAGDEPNSWDWNAWYDAGEVSVDIDAEPNAILAVLIADLRGLLKRLVVIDAEHAAVQRSPLEDQPSVFRKEKTRPRMPKGPIRLEALEIGGAHLPRESIQF